MPSVNLGPATTTTVNLQAPISTEFTIQTIAVTMTPVSVATITTAEQSFGAAGVTQVTAATGILAGDVLVAVNAPAHVAGVVAANWRVDPGVNDKFYITFVNPTAGGVVPASGVYLLTVMRYSQSNRGPGTTLATMGLPTSIQL
jgi:hypothetical protein